MNRSNELKVYRSDLLDEWALRFRRDIKDESGFPVVAGDRVNLFGNTAIRKHISFGHNITIREWLPFASSDFDPSRLRINTTVRRERARRRCYGSRRYHWRWLQKHLNDYLHVKGLSGLANVRRCWTPHPNPCHPWNFLYRAVNTRKGCHPRTGYRSNVRSWLQQRNGLWHSELSNLCTSGDHSTQRGLVNQSVLANTALRW